MAQSSLLDRALSLAAGVVAAAALLTPLYEARINRPHQKIAVWPYLTQFNSDSGGVYTRQVANVGLGPALVRSFQVRVDGRVVRDWGAVRAALMPDAAWHRSESTSFGLGSVLTPNGHLTLLQLGDSADARRFHSVVDRLETQVCYCSLYDECWRVSSKATTPVKVSACPDDSQEEFAR